DPEDGSGCAWTSAKSIGMRRKNWFPAAINLSPPGASAVPVDVPCSFPDRRPAPLSRAVDLFGSEPDSRDPVRIPGTSPRTHTQARQRAADAVSFSGVRGGLHRPE